MKDLKGKVAVITGAGSGFGREFARLGAREGMKLVLADVQRDALDAVVGEVRGAGTEVIGEIVDVGNSGQVAQLADRAFQAFGPVHLLMNNAGVGGGGYLWENTYKDWDWVLGVNLVGVVHGITVMVGLPLARGKSLSRLATIARVLICMISFKPLFTHL
jgi:NAD(P)-dependent dehydrogenase (short-subunit alcohol dehydrogenase family)